MGELALEGAWEWGGARVKRECFIFKVNEEMGRMEFGEEGVAPIVHWPAIPPWILPVPEIDLSVLAYERTATFGGIVRERLNNTWGQSIQIYTDGAQDPRTGILVLLFASQIWM